MIAIDALDRRILAVLQADARISNAELAERVGLSPSPCWRRVRRLEQEGVIKRSVSLLDAEKVGLGVSVFINVTLEKHTATLKHDFEKVILQRPEVMECYSMTGIHDYLLRVVVPDIVAYERFLDAVLMHLKGVASVNSSFALKQIKYETALPVDAGVETEAV